MLWQCNLSASTSLCWSMNHVPPYLFLSRENDDGDRDIGKHDFRSVLLHSMLLNTSLLRGTDCWCFLLYHFF